MNPDPPIATITWGWRGCRDCVFSEPEGDGCALDYLVVTVTIGDVPGAIYCPGRTTPQDRLLESGDRAYHEEESDR